jgi:ribosomal protein S20
MDLLKKCFSLFDKLAKRGIIHRNKAAGHKSRLSKFVNHLAA